jgi:hypothetical protein
MSAGTVWVAGTIAAFDALCGMPGVEVREQVYRRPDPDASRKPHDTKSWRDWPTDPDAAVVLFLFHGRIQGMANGETYDIPRMIGVYISCRQPAPFHVRRGVLEELGLAATLEVADVASARAAEAA